MFAAFVIYGFFAVVIIGLCIETYRDDKKAKRMRLWKAEVKAIEQERAKEKRRLKTKMKTLERKKQEQILAVLEDPKLGKLGDLPPYTDAISDPFRGARNSANETRCPHCGHLDFDDGEPCGACGKDAYEV